MKQTKMFKKIKGSKNIVCLACNHYCAIKPNETGKCGVRKNTNGNLELLVYGKALGIGIDPIEKKPLFHFLPGTNVYSFGTAGCNFTCKFCQNWQMSQVKENPMIVNLGEEIQPKEIVEFCTKNKIPSIAYTYNEPTVFFEYAYDTMLLAKKNGIKNIFVSNGFMSKEVLEKIKGVIDAVNIDLKSFDEKFYEDICGGRLKLILDNIKRFFENNIWIEITTLLIPGLNDGEKNLNLISKFIFDISPKIPLHFSAFYPTYKMTDRGNTTFETLKNAYDIAKKVGLNYVYIGNVRGNGFENTICPKCKKTVIERNGYEINCLLQNGKCPYCDEIIPGIR